MIENNSNHFQKYYQKLNHVPYTKDSKKKRIFIILLIGIRKTPRRVAASYMRSTCQETNPDAAVNKWSTRICYVLRGETILNDRVFEKGERFSKSFMVVGIISERGTVSLLGLLWPARVKINAEYYVKYVLKPLFSDHLPRLYRNEFQKMFLHHDKASSHTANLTTSYMDNIKSVSFISKWDKPVKTPEVALLIFSSSVIWSRYSKREETEHWMRFGNLLKSRSQRSISI